MWQLIKVGTILRSSKKLRMVVHTKTSNEIICWYINKKGKTTEVEINVHSDSFVNPHYKNGWSIED